MKDYTVVIERDEDGIFVGSIVELPGCHSQGGTVQELLENIKEAAQLYTQVEGLSGKNLKFYANSIINFV